MMYRKSIFLFLLSISSCIVAFCQNQSNFIDDDLETHSLFKFRQPENIDIAWCSYNPATLIKYKDIIVLDQKTNVPILHNSIFTNDSVIISIKKKASPYFRKRPDPAGWYAGDIHVHRNCGDGTEVIGENKLLTMMEPNNLDVISLLADMGNGEVKYSNKDLLKVNGKDIALSSSQRIIHWDTEWHWDATYSNYGHQALGGHLVILGLKNANQIWDESVYKIVEWAKKQGAISGFAHFGFLKDTFQNQLDCCIPIEYPVEAALGTIDFISEDVNSSTTPNSDKYNSKNALDNYYKLLNCGFKLGLAAGTDFPCNGGEAIGSLLTYVKVKNGLTYKKWIKGIKEGRSVISRNGHNEFIELKADGNHNPGDIINTNNKKQIKLTVKWTGIKVLSGTIEVVCNGKVIASKEASITPEKPIVFSTTYPIEESSWICARRMDERGHQTHTAPIYIIVNKKPISASAADATFFIDWINQLIKNTSPGGSWSHFFTKDLNIVQGRYQKAKAIFIRILKESQLKK